MADVTIYLVDDHAVLRDGLKVILGAVPGYRVVGEAGDGKTAIEEIERIKPMVVILDISLPVMTGIDVARQLKKYHPEIRIIILSQHGNEEYVNKLLGFGVEGYLFKESASQYLVQAIDEVSRGNIHLDPNITRMLVDGMTGVRPTAKEPKNGVLPALSEREKEVLKLIAEGYTGKEIGAMLRISEQTVKVHRANIVRKIKAESTADLVRYAVREGLIQV
ncbi:MAG TPA: response regulator transcription factor [Spirochaetota bacterium]|nr:response regulator transcription factor [Spirochaetota bacterium]HPL17153.1 response regulator transcription factor [Spirochaetota bacterium]HQJ69966.1 response regulator transcription factor [Spirochaetota bacterium]HRS77508.1 response regulator transcription factor [Spirochaetota bacterium]HRT75227.1 response regulator transcription factor [Spirochaetota bacterium]